MPPRQVENGTGSKLSVRELTDRSQARGALAFISLANQVRCPGCNKSAESFTKQAKRVILGAPLQAVTERRQIACAHRSQIVKKAVHIINKLKPVLGDKP